MKAERRATYVWLPIILLSLSGCEESPPPTQPAPEIPVRVFWSGSWVDHDDGTHGVILLDLTVSGHEVTGEALLEERGVEDSYPDHLQVTGTRLGDGLFLTLDPEERAPGPFSLAAARTGSGLTGTVSYVSLTDSAAFESRAVPVGQLTHVMTVELPRMSAKGLAFDGGSIWIATTFNYQIMNTDGEIQDSVIVTLGQDARWTSDAITSDGSRMWGSLNHTIIHSNGEQTRGSKIHEFDRAGEIASSLEIFPRMRALAWGEGTLWSLSSESDTIYRIDPSGTHIERIDVHPSDLVDLEFDGRHFWAIGWFLPKLYQIDRAGQIVRVFDLPEAESGQSTGVTWDGRHLWYSRSLFTSDSKIYKMRIE